MRKVRLYLLWCFVSLGIMAQAAVYGAETLINPNIADKHQYVADPDNLLNAATKAQVNKMLWDLRQKTSVEMAVVVVPDIEEGSVEEFSGKIFDKWKIGKGDKDNGVLLVVVPQRRDSRITTGYGVEGVLPDITAGKIIRENLVPAMQAGDLNAAVSNSVAGIVNVLTTPEAVAELKSNQADSWHRNNAMLPEEDQANLTWIFGFFVVVMGVFSFGFFFYELLHLRKYDRYGKARAWNDNKLYFIILAVLSLGIGLIPLLLSRRQYHKSRNGKMQCGVCGGRMHKLNEEEDNQFLNPAQDLEERLNSVDYDVWVCDKCGGVEKFAFPNKFTKYEECPHCHTKAMCLIRDHTLLAPTRMREGIGERIYECKYCHNNTRRRYKLPRQDGRGAAALGAAAIMGAASRGGSSGGFGGGIGGGFGGGRTGGGGASGRW